MGGPGSAKGGQGFKFDGKTQLILTIPFFAPSAFWKVPRGSRERVRRPGWPPRRSLERGRGSKRSLREAKNERSLFFRAPGGPESEQASKNGFWNTRYLESSNIPGDGSKQMENDCKVGPKQHTTGPGRRGPSGAHRGIYIYIYIERER